MKVQLRTLFPKNINTLIYLYVFLLISTINFSSCKKNPTEPINHKIPPTEKQVFRIEVEDVICIEAWLKITADSLPLPANISLQKDEKDVMQITLTTIDTTIIIESLLPKQTYKFRARSTSDTLLVTNLATATTLDTTSHNFSWQSWTFGEHSSSVLYDVAIIDENNIWAVGEIYMKDSLGNYDPNAYNAMHWDGSKWELKRIQFYTFCNQQYTGSYPAKSIFAFGQNDIWIGMDGSQVVKWNGNSQSLPICTPVSINKLWGSSSNNLYAVGNNGNIAHWDGSSWQKYRKRDNNRYT